MHNGVFNIRESKIHFVDLAGSERQKQTMAVGDRLKEANNINKSLTVLGQVINCLVENAQGKSRHIPYRDSKLTFLLKDSLGGNSKTYMIAAISSASNAFAETLSTLKFAQRAKMIKNKALINEESSGNLDLLKKELKRLKDELLSATNIINEMQQRSNEIKEINNFQAKLTPNFELLIEKREKTIISRGKLWSGSKFILEKEKFLEIENFFKSNFKEIHQNYSEITEITFKFEVERQEWKEILFLSVKNEINYKMIIKLCHLRLIRVNNKMENCSNDSLIQEILNLKDENERLHEILANSENMNFKKKTMSKYGKSRFLMLLNDNKRLMENIENHFESRKEHNLNQNIELMKNEFSSRLENLTQENIM